MAGDHVVRQQPHRPRVTPRGEVLEGAAVTEPEGDAAQALFTDAGAYDAWAARWRRRLAQEPGEPEEADLSCGR